ncbi:peptide deformylase [Capillibacterium thermochitinicola]|uniref:Peptide deformylase n=1 Tax=Capillibacterium thermochitinicola TaxID=2699427 RepID=A0A8J6I311_9FIRM|nr:peptide deformylase [Capillibacterium thermochitinicola]MBA2133559.1 peptide deformylase [Capillibacterium thermochitinicola]
MVLPILTEPNPLLRQKAKPVKKITKRIKKLTQNMLETMYAADGVGLAGPQVGVSERIIVIDVGDGPIVLVNPEIVSATGEERDVEGCLSIPGRNGYVTRAAKVKVAGVDLEGRRVELVGEGLLARAFQHEIDHLDGILFIDYLSPEAEGAGR